MNPDHCQEWTGLIGELVSERADLIMAPLTINPERAQVGKTNTVRNEKRSEMSFQCLGDGVQQTI